MDRATLGRSALVILAIFLFFTVASSTAVAQSCPQPSSPGVNICSPANGSTVTSPFTISASGRNTNATAGLDVWLDGKKVGWYNGTTVDIQVSAATGSHQLDIYSVGVDNELKEATVFFTVGSTASGGGATGGSTSGTCTAPSTPGVVICSPTQGSTVTSPVSISAAGRNSGTTDGMDVYIDGHHTGWYGGTTVINISVSLADGSHQLDVYAVGTSGELQESTVTFTVGSTSSGGTTGGTTGGSTGGTTGGTTGSCAQPSSAGVNICSPLNGSTVTSPVTISAAGRNSGTTDGMDVWMDGKKLGWFGGTTTVNTQATLATGTHELDIYAVGTNGELKEGTSIFTVGSGTTSGGSTGGTNTAPFGFVDSANGSQSGTSTFSQSETMNVAGWAADQEDGAPVTRVAVLIDGNPVGNATLGGVRTDVATAYNNTAYTNSGWTFSYPASSMSAGTHNVSAVAYDSQGAAGSLTSPKTVTVLGTAGDTHQINHVIFMMQENRSFDNYFGMLNGYKNANGWATGDDGKTYLVDGLDHPAAQIVNTNDEGASFAPFKLGTSCIDDLSSAWLESYGDVYPWSFSTSRPITMNGFVHIAEGFAKDLGLGDTSGKRTMGYYDQNILNYYYFMASQFAVSDRWFSPMSSKTVPNRIATMSGGTTQGLTKDPSNDDHLGQLNIETIFQELSNAGVSWKIYYTDVDPNGAPSTSFFYFTYANNFIGDTSHVAPLSQFYTDVQNGTLPAFAYIEPGFNDGTDEHPGVDVVRGQRQVANLINALMNSVSWKDSVFFLSYDEGGPFDHVPPVPGQTNKYTDPSLGITTDISSIAVNPDGYKPCPLVSGSYHCDLHNYGSYQDPGWNSGDAPAQQGFAAQLGFRVPNLVISPFTRRHYVSHVPMDHTAIIKFVENRFIGSTAHLTARDAAQPNLLDFFDFTNTPWAQPPAPPAPASATCDPSNLNPAP